MNNDTPKPKGKIIGSASAREPQTRVQIAVLETSRQVFEINDALSTDVEKHKVNLVIVDHGDAGPVKIANHWVNAARMKALCKAIIEGRLEQLAGISLDDRRAGKRVQLYLERKGKKRRTAEGYDARILELWLDPRADYPYQVVIKNGDGAPVGTGGAVKLVGKPLVDLMYHISALDMYTLASEALDYIQAWELHHFTKLREGHQVTKVPLDHPWLREDVLNRDASDYGITRMKNLAPARRVAA